MLIPVYLALGNELHTTMATARLLNAVAMSVASVTFVRKRLAVSRLVIPMLLLDIRFVDEASAWTMGFGKHIPLNELPDRLRELDPAKTIVTLCPHYDRAEIARLYPWTCGSLRC